MKKITMFVMESCPYCKAALRCMEELCLENPDYKDLEIERIDERVYPEIAEKFDYYYVPAYYIDDKKLHEGAASIKNIRRVFNAALKR